MKMLLTKMFMQTILFLLCMQAYMEYLEKNGAFEMQTK